MPIALSCSGCKSQYQIPDEFAGRQTKCRKCGASLQIPGRAAPPPPAPPAAEAGELEFTAGAAPVAVQAYRRKATTKPRRGLWIAIAVVVLLLGGGAAAFYWLFSPAGQLGESARYLPNNTRFLALIRVDQLVAAGTWAEIENRLPGLKKSMDELEKNTGLARGDIEQIMIGWTLAGTETDEQLTIIRTKRDISAAEIREREEYAPFKEAPAGKYTLYEGPVIGAVHRSAPAFSVPESRVLILGGVDMLRTVLERDKKPGFVGDMQDRIADTDFSKPLAFALNLKGATIKGMLTGFKMDAGSLEGVVGQIDPGSSQASITFVMDTVGRAGALHKTIESQLKELKVRRADRQELVEAIEAVQVRTSDNKVIATAPIGPAALVLRATGFVR
jgi:hypothetical protein